MSVWMSRLTSVMVMLALSGSPATLVACLAACLETHAAHDDERAAARPHCESASVAASAVIEVPCSDCWNDAPSMAAAAGRTDRQAVHTLQVAASTEVVMLHAVSRRPVPGGPIAAISPSPPIRASVPLRI